MANIKETWAGWGNAKRAVVSAGTVAGSILAILALVSATGVPTPLIGDQVEYEATFTTLEALTERVADNEEVSDERHVKQQQSYKRAAKSEKFDLEQRKSAVEQEDPEKALMYQEQITNLEEEIEEAEQEVEEIREKRKR